MGSYTARGLFMVKSTESHPVVGKRAHSGQTQVELAESSSVCSSLHIDISTAP